MEIAGYSKLSATANLIKTNCQRLKEIERPAISIRATLWNLTHQNPTQDPFESEKKLYIPVHINKYRIIGCVDSGSDLTIMHYSLYCKIREKPHRLAEGEVKCITTFSDTNIGIKGKFSCRLRLNETHQGIEVDMYVIPDIPNQTPLLLGNDLIRKGLGKIGYTNVGGNVYPEITFSSPNLFRCDVFHVAPRDLNRCEAICDLLPHETQDVEFLLNQAAPIIRTDYILITAVQWGTVSIVPSRTEVEFSPKQKAFIGTARVINASDQRFKGRVLGKFETINKFKAIEISRENRTNLLSNLKAYPLGREALEIGREANIKIPIPCVSQVSSYQEGIQVSDLKYDLADTVMTKEPTYSGEGEISEEIFEPHGIDLPTVIYRNASEAIDLNKFPSEIGAHIKRIFLEKHPEAVALHAMDSGDFSLTLGYIKLRLREGESLPRAKRIFHISPSDQRHLDDICDFLIKYGYIRRAKPDPNGTHLYGLSSYLVPRAKPGTLGRLVVDFSPINPLIEQPSSVIPEITATLQTLQNKAMYTSLDLRYAFMGLKIDEESSKLTTFLTPSGSYQWLSLPTGSANSPAYFTDCMNKILHHKPIKNRNGEIIFEEPNVVKQTYDPLPFVTNYLDDILITGELKTTFSETVEEHFRNVEAAVDRLAFHGCKINISKCEFAKTKILFLGWYIVRNYIVADPRRVEKVRDFKFPENKKAMRAFLGLVNSLRRVINLSVIQQITILTPLTSSKTNFVTNESHIRAFEEIKRMLISEPLFANLIDEKAEKYLFCDAATKTGVMGAVLLQKIRGKDEKIVPNCLDLDNEVHRIIYDKELPYEPVRLYTSMPIVQPKPGAAKTRPPDVLPESDLLGFSPENVHESFFYSTISILALYNCHLLESTLEYRKLAVKKLRSGTLNLKLKDFTFNLDYKACQDFINNFLEGKVGLDPELYLAEALASALYRPMIFISTLERHKNKRIFNFNRDSDKPPLVYGIYSRNGYEIYLPFFHNKHTEFRLESLKDKVQIIAYMSKTVPETYKSRPILDLEVFGVLTSLYSLQRFISGVKVTLLTDSRVLFYLFSSRVHNSSVKIKRWCLKLISDYPLVNLHFVRTTSNLADFLTREGLPEGDLERFNLEAVQITDFHDKLPQQTFTLEEWINFVEYNPHYLTINNKEHLEGNPVVMAIQRGIENIKSVTTPLEILKERLSRESLIAAQREEFMEIIKQCQVMKNFQHKPIDRDKDDPTSYKLSNGLLMADVGEGEKENLKILLPYALIGPMLAHIHLTGHKGINRMLLELEDYYFKNKYSLTRRFIECCYSCFLSTSGNKHSFRGIYPTPSRAFEEISLDLAENIGAIKGYENLLIAQCNFSGYILIYPLRTKRNSEISKTIRDNLLQVFNIDRIRTDNAPGFRSLQWLEDLAIFGVQVINSSSLNPSSNGSIERAVQTVKLMYKRILATRPNYNWEFLNIIVSKIYNTSISPQSGYKPAELVFGKGEASRSYLDLERYVPPHHLVKNKRKHIEELTEELRKISKEAKESIENQRQKNADRLNKNGVDKGLRRHDYVFIKDRTEIPGATRPLRTKLDSSPYVILEVKYNTVLVMRLSDGFTSLYAMDDVKKYDKSSPLFASLPKEVTEIMLHSFADLLSDDFSTIMEYDKLEIPSGRPINRIKEKPKDIERANQEKNSLNSKDIDEEGEEISSEEEDNTKDNPDKWKGRLRSHKKKVSFSQDKEYL
jgi:transposase InsO family protein